ncbi:MAG: CgeB family protein [Calditrichota bacterium]
MSDRIDLRYFADDYSITAVQSAADLPTMRARNGLPTMDHKGMRLHSTVDPLAEAETQLEGLRGELDDILAKSNESEINIVILGPGLGYAINALERMVNARFRQSHLHIICVEMNAEIARKAVALHVWEPTPLKISWYVGNESTHDIERRINGKHLIVIRNTTGYRLNKDEYDRMAAQLIERPVPERPLRVLVPTPLYGGSLPIAFHCADAFRNLGHQVEVLDLSSYYSLYQAAEKVTADARHVRTLQGLLTTYLAETVAARAMDWRADLVWAVAQTPLTPACLAEMRHERIHTAFWFVEDYSVFNYWRELASHFDAVFTIQQGQFLNELRQVGAAHTMYLPCAANPAVHQPIQLSTGEYQRYGSDVSFIGAGYRNRQILFAQLGLPDFKIWGNDWPDDCAVRSRIQENGRRVSAAETAKIYSAAKINLNLHSSPHHQAVNPNGDYVNPRTFEIAACGGFQLVDMRSDLMVMFDSEEMVAFRDAGEIPQLVEYYLAHETNRKEIAARARQRVLREHTYEHRMAAALSFLEANYPKLSDRKRGPNYISSLKTAAGDDAELLKFLSQFDDDEEVTLDQIVSRIKIGNGRLSKSEGMFLLMKEFRDWGREKGVIQ